jgi:hypothetical protein
MALVTRCGKCAATGVTKCVACQCQSCAGLGTVKCASCSNGKVPCGECSSTGQTSCPSCSGFGKATQQFWFFKWAVSCPTCGGAARRQCAKCAGRKVLACGVCAANGQLPCAVCGGSGLSASCPVCNGTRKTVCLECKGAGTFETDWSRQLKSSPVDRLRFEYEKRQRSIQSLQVKISRLSRELDEMYEDYEERRAANPRLYDAAGTEPSGLNDIPREIGSYERDISQAEEEMGDIQTVLDAKWH